jgi:hypothetical protein
MRIGTALVLAAALLPAQDKPEYTFGTTVVSNSWLQGQIYDLKPGTERLPRLDRMKPTGTIYTNTLNIWPQRFDQGFPGITDRFEWFAIDYRGKFWIEQEGEYRFSLLSDDGAKLEVDNREIIDNDGTHRPIGLSGSALLSRGVHTIRVSYYQGPRHTVALVLAIGPPGARWRIFNVDEFLPPKDPSEWITGKISGVQKGVLE